MTNLITEARELIEDLHEGRNEGEYIEDFTQEILLNLCDALENTEKQLQEQFDKTGAWLEEYNEMKIALKKAQEQKQNAEIHADCMEARAIAYEAEVEQLREEVYALREDCAFAPMPPQTPAKDHFVDANKMVAREGEKE